MNIIRNIFNVKLISIIAMVAFLFATTATTYAFRPFFPFPTDPGPACTVEELFAIPTDPTDEEGFLRLLNNICAVYDTWRLTAGSDASLSGTLGECQFNDPGVPPSLLPLPPNPFDLYPLFDVNVCGLINAFGGLGGLDSLCDGARFGPDFYPFPGL